MRAQAKRSSAANRDGSATRGSVFGRRNAATRASFPSADGSGAPSHRGHLTVLALAIAAFALLALAPLAGAKTVVNGFGISGNFGGEFGSPLGVAVNNSGNGAARGTVYVVDSNSRIQRFSPSGAFERTWGQDVTSTTVNEQQRVLLKGATAGTYRLSFRGFETEAIAFNAIPSTVRAVLGALPSISGDANIAVSGVSSDYTVTFQGAFAAADQPQLVPIESGLTGALAISNIADGANSATTGGASTGFEICTVASHCKAGSTSGTTANGGQLSSPQGIAVNQSNGNVYVTESGNRRVSEFRADGTFVRTWGWDVISRGRGTNVAQNEIQTVTLDPNITGGTFQLRFGGTAPVNTSTAIDWDADAAEVRTALETIAALTGNVNVTSTNPGGGVLGGPYAVEFRGALADTDVATITSVNTSLIGPTRTITIATLAEGTLAFEICSDATGADCKQAAVAPPAAINAGGGRFGATIGYPVTDSSDNVWVPDATNRRIQQFDSSGNFIAAYGHNVDRLGGGGAMESCTSTVPGDCQTGTQGSTAGQFASNNPTQIAFDNAGNLYARDAGNTRVQRFDPTILASVSNFGTATFPTYTTQAPENLIATQGGTRLVFSVNNNVTGGGERQLLEIDPSDASVRDTSLVNSRLTNVGGLGVNADSGNLYATTTTSPPVSPRRVLLLSSTPLSDLALAINAVTVKGETTATFNGTINPNGGLAGSCLFQYSTDQRNWTGIAEPDCDTLAPGGGIQVVSEKAFGLRPNTRYFVRLQANRPLVPGSLRTTGVSFFVTDSPPPGVSGDVGAIQIADTSARLVGTIDPKNSDTGYVFEYGTTPALGSSTAPVDIGAGNTPITVSQVVGGLTPDTTYYFKLAATNDFGTTRSVSRTFHTRTEPLPAVDARGYEMVSPVDKNFGNISKIAGTGIPWEAGVALDGETAGFCSAALFGEPTGQMFFQCAPYISKRNPVAGRWETTHPFPTVCFPDQSTGFSEGGGPVIRLNAEMDRYAIRQPESTGCPNIPLLDPAAPLRSVEDNEMSSNLYYGDLSTDPVSHTLLNRALSPAGVHPETNGNQEKVEGGSDDFGHVIYSSPVDQTGPGDAPPTGLATKLYDWERQGTGDCVQPGGCLTLLSRDTNNDPFMTNARMPAYRATANLTFSPPSAVSRDGERIYFQTGMQSESRNSPGICVAGCDLYMRENATTTYYVSESQCTIDCGTHSLKADNFLSATPNGDKAFFMSCAKLTNASSPEGSCASIAGVDGVHGIKLYRWDRGAAPGNRLVDLTVDLEPSDGNLPAFIGLVGHSEDGDTVYFVTHNQIVSGQPAFTSSAHRGDKLYRWQWNNGSPSVDYLGRHDKDNSDNSVADFNTAGTKRQVTADGRYMLIHTPLPYDRAADSDSDVDAYRWDEEGGWICVSCQLPGTPSAGDADLSTVSLKGTGEGPLFPPMSNPEPRVHMSDDGQRIFFGTPDALVPEDTNGEVSCPVVQDLFNLRIRSCLDVYEWHDGKINLISSGKGTGPSRLISGTPSGRDVFFYSYDALVGWDRDNFEDIYTARIGGGFPEPPATGAPCEGEACRGAGTAPSNIPGAASRAIEGPGNQRRVFPEACGLYTKQAQRKLAAAKKATKKGQVRRAQALRKQARNLNRRATRCNRRQAS